VSETRAELLWGPGTATAVGSMPGTDPLEAVRVVAGELPLLPHLPELPARGVGADLFGRTAAVLLDLPVEVVPSGYRVAAHPGMDQRRAEDLLRFDLDALQQVLDVPGAAPAAVKVQLAGPWSLSAGIELPRGHRVLTDRGALHEFTESLSEGLTRHVAEVAARTGAPVVVQLDEPSLPTILAGRLPTPSGFGTVAAVPVPDATEVLGTVIEAAAKATGHPVIVHCCAAAPPLRLFTDAGAGALSFDVGLVAGETAPAGVWDTLGELWESGTTLFLGLVPTSEPARPLALREAAGPALRLADRLGFDRSWLAERAVPTPACGLAGAKPAWARRALTLTRELAAAFVEPPEAWAKP
jgi:methionine synthase II (cobalamin-independent)